ncbi:MAG: GHKL domain-containing protein [Thermoanaerobaculia bacterium]|nr:GHKL domain-containing protein [Thermoanaerobaculia bacterium]
MFPRPRRPPSRRNWIIFALLGLFILSDLALFSWLIFQTLSRRELDRVLLETRREAQDLAGRIAGSAESTGGDLFTAVALERETQTYIDSVLRQRQIVQTVEITDRDGVLVMKERRETEIAAPARAASAERELPAGTPRVESRTLERQESRAVQLPSSAVNSLDVTVPIGEFGSLRIGISPLEMDRRIGELRQELVRQTTWIGGLTVAIFILAFFLISALIRRGQRLEAQAAEAERLAYLGTLAAGLAHEIRNPLNSLSLNMQMLEEDLASAQAASGQKKLLAITRSEIGRLERLVSDFLSYARPRALRLETVPAAELLERARDVVAREFALRGAIFEVTDESPGAAVRVDEEQLQQLLINLLQNALAASEGTGRPPRVVLRSRREGPRVLLEVEDNGAGIPDEIRERIFELFFSTRKGGSGLGLAIAERVVRAHGGELSFESEVGRGSIFRVALPLSVAQPPAGTAAAPQDPGDR